MSDTQAPEKTTPNTYPTLASPLADKLRFICLVIEQARAVIQARTGLEVDLNAYLHDHPGNLPDEIYQAAVDVGFERSQWLTPDSKGGTYAWHGTDTSVYVVDRDMPHEPLTAQVEAALLRDAVEGRR